MKVGVVAHEARTGVLTHPLVPEVPTGLQHKQQSSQFTGTITEPHTNDNTAFLERSLGKILSEPHGVRADAATRGAARRKINQNSDVSPVQRPTTSEATLPSEGFVSLAAAHPDLKRQRETLKCAQPLAPSPSCSRTPREGDVFSPGSRWPGVPCSLRHNARYSSRWVRVLCTSWSTAGRSSAL